MMSMNRSRYASQYRQGGAFSIMAAGTLTLALLCLMLVVDSGRLYMEQRSLQRVADMAALEAASRGGVCRDADGTSTAFGFAEDATKRNKLNKLNKLNEDNLSSVTCVNLITNTDGVRVLDPVNPVNESSPIIQVIVEKTTPASLVIQAGCLFTSCENKVTLQATAVAVREEPIAAFSVGSRLIRFDSESALGGVLGLAGLNLDTLTIASYEGLANVKITPAGLLDALGVDVTTILTVGDLNRALVSVDKVSVAKILEVTATVVDNKGLLDAKADLLRALNTTVGISGSDLTIPLLTQADGTRGLFAEIIAPATQSANAALSAQISALSIIETALGLATHKHAIAVDKLNINLLGLVKVTTKVGVIEPPSITIGAPTKRNSDGDVIRNGATAYTAQVRTFIHLKTDGLLGALIKIDLPIALDLVTGRGVLEEKTCTANAVPRNASGEYAEITAWGEVGKLCIGRPTNEDELFSKSLSCEASMRGMEHLNILGLVTLDRSSADWPLTMNLFDIPEDDVYLSLDSNPIQTVGSNSFNIGTLTERLLALLLGGGNQRPYQLGEVVDKVWRDATPPGPSCPDIDCRNAKMKSINAATGAVEDSEYSLLGSLVGGLGKLLGALVDALAGNGCTKTGLAYWETTDAICKNKIQDTLPSSTEAPSGLGLGILRDILDDLRNRILTPILEDLLGLQIGEMDVHLQDLNCGHARLLR